MDITPQLIGLLAVKAATGAPGHHHAGSMLLVVSAQEKTLAAVSVNPIYKFELF